MKILSLTKVAQALLRNNVEYNLTRYIFNVQQFELARLDFELAGDAIGVSDRTVARKVRKLAELGILFIEGDKLRLNEDLAKN